MAYTSDNVLQLPEASGLGNLTTKSHTRGSGRSPEVAFLIKTLCVKLKLTFEREKTKNASFYGEMKKKKKLLAPPLHQSSFPRHRSSTSRNLDSCLPSPNPCSIEPGDKVPLIYWEDLSNY